MRLKPQELVDEQGSLKAAVQEGKAVIMTESDKLNP